MDKVCYYKDRPGYEKCEGDIELALVGKEGTKMREQLREMTNENILVGVCKGHEQTAKRDGLL